METFSDVLQSYVNSSKVKPSFILRKLQQKNIKISKASFYRYLNGESIPSTSKAFAITECLSINLTYEQLLKIIFYSESMYEATSLNKDMIPINIKLNCRKVIDAEDSKRIIKDRIELTSSNITDYITKLIRKDLDIGILEEGVDYGIKEIL